MRNECALAYAVLEVVCFLVHGDDDNDENSSDFDLSL